MARDHRRRRRRAQRWSAQPDQARLLCAVHAEDADVHSDSGADAACLRCPSCAMCAPSSFASIANSRSCACGISRPGSRIFPSTLNSGLVARLFGIFSMLALALSAVGLYSVVSYGVATRTNEFGIRMALGARARDVVRMVLSGTSWNVGVGLLAGVLLCLVFDKRRLTVGDRELARSTDPWRRDRPAACRCRHGVSCSGTPRGVDRSDGRPAARVTLEVVSKPQWSG